MKTNKTQVDYTAYGTGDQLYLPMNCEMNIPKDDPVRLLSAMIERMNLDELFATYSEKGRTEYSPRILLKICVYGYMRKIISSRELERACTENTKFMYLLEGKNPPDHNTISRFRNRHLAACQNVLLLEQTKVLMKMGEVSFAKSAVFIDGTKIESLGNRYQFVWKKSVEKSFLKLQEKIKAELPELVQAVGLKFQGNSAIKLHRLKRLRKKLCAKMNEAGIQRVHGTGKRKSVEQRVLEKLETWIAKTKEYLRKIHICGSRNSYCKTDEEATFMRMKEDYMRNGQLKPGYNINVATVSEYIVGNYVSSDRTDTRTTIPFMEWLQKIYPVNRVVYDSGYESEEAYRYFEAHPQLDLYVKPANHEQKKKKKYRTDISRRENMAYDAETDTYTCASGKKLSKVGVRSTKNESGYVSEKTIYACKDCSGCPVKEQCIRSKSSTPLEERNKRMEVAKYFAEQRAAMEEKISTEEGKQLRVNRSIQAEGVFAYMKADLSFRRFLCHGISRVGAEWTLLSMAYNLWRLHHKGINGRLGTHLFAI